MYENYQIHKQYQSLSTELKAAFIFVEAREKVEGRELDKREVEQTVKEILKIFSTPQNKSLT